VDRFAARAADLAALHGEGFAMDDALLGTLRRHQPKY